MKTMKTNNKNTVKFYDLSTHRSYTVKKSSVNVTASRNNPGEVHIHTDTKDCEKTPCKCGVLYVSNTMWKKINRGHRAEW